MPHIDSIFSLGNPTPCDVLNKLTPPTQKGAVSNIDAGEDVPGQSRKMPRAQESSVLSRLIERGSLPVSVCRLISDLVDIGPKGRASHPIRSFDDVAQDIPAIALTKLNCAQGAVFLKV